MSETFEQAKALFFEGNEHFEAGRFEKAEASFEESLALVPGRVSTLANLAATRLELGKPEAALVSIEEALAIDPSDLDAWLHKGIALSALGRHAEALELFDGVVEREPTRGAAWFRRGQALQRIGRTVDALASFDKALAREPTLAEAWTRRGDILRDQKRLDEAAAAYEQALAHGADPQTHRYYLAAVTGRELPPVAPSAYVEPLFDEYAESFEQHLVKDLKYRGHALLVDEWRALDSGRHASAVDLGCGTGLCAPLLRGRVDRLEGVDLSSRMLEKAHALGLYDALVQGDAVEYLRSTDRRHDLIFAADMFIYLGDLDPLFAAAARVAPSGGLFCFSAELGSGARDYELLPSLRYAHSRQYLQALPARHGFALRRLVEAPLREEQRQAVQGLYVCLAKS